MVVLDLFASWTAEDDDDERSTLLGLVEELRALFPYFGVLVSECLEATDEPDSAQLGFVQEFARWLYARTHEVYNDLERHQSDDGQPQPQDIRQPDWTLVSAY